MECNGTTNGLAPTSAPPTTVSHIDTRVPAPLSFLRPFVPRFILSMLNMPRFIWRVLQFQDPPSLPAHDPPDPLPLSDPQLPLPQSVTSLTSSRPAPPSPAMSRRASGLSRASSRPASGMVSAASSRPPSGIHHSRSVSGASPRLASSMQLITPITTTPTTPLATPRRPNHVSTSSLDVTPAEPTPTPTATTTASHVITTASPTTVCSPLIQIRDYGFAPSDLRFSGQGPHVPRANRPAVLARRLASSTPTSSSESDSSDGEEGDDNEEDEDDEEDGAGVAARMSIDMVPGMWEEVVDDETNGWGGFKWGGFNRTWGFGKMSEIAPGGTSAGFPSRGDLDRNFGGEDEYEDMEIDEGDLISDEEDVETETETGPEPPLLCGLYRALYAFEPEGTAEMKLDEDQLVRVIGRGGGVGWAVVVKGGLKDTGVHALVPESYLEPVRLDGEEDA